MITDNELCALHEAVTDFEADLVRLARLYVFAGIGLARAAKDFGVDTAQDRAFLSDLIEGEAQARGFTKNRLEGAVLALLRASVTTNLLDTISL